MEYSKIKQNIEASLQFPLSLELFFTYSEHIVTETCETLGHKAEISMALPANTCKRGRESF